MAWSPAYEGRKVQVELRGIFSSSVFPPKFVPLTIPKRAKLNLGQERFVEDEVDEEGKEGGCLIRKAQQKLVGALMSTLLVAFKCIFTR